MRFIFLIITVLISFFSCTSDTTVIDGSLNPIIGKHQLTSFDSSSPQDVNFDGVERISLLQDLLCLDNSIYIELFENGDVNMRIPFIETDFSNGTYSINCFVTDYIGKYIYDGSIVLISYNNGYRLRLTNNGGLLTNSQNLLLPRLNDNTIYTYQENECVFTYSKLP